MLETARLIYGACHVLALAAFAFSGLWRRFFAAFLMLAAIAVTAATYSPEMRDWIRLVYVPVESVAVLLRFLAAVEAIYYHTEELDQQLLLIVSLLLASISVMAIIWEITPGSTVEVFVQVRRYVQIGTGVFLLVGVVFLWSQRLWQSSITGWHTIILLVLVLKHAIYSLAGIRGLWPNGKAWNGANGPSLLINILCCLAWITIAVWFARDQRRAQSSEPGPPYR